MLASVNGHDSIVTYLIQNGAEISMINDVRIFLSSFLKINKQL